MSKKSRRRNKRLLMLAALAGGAAFMGRGAKGNVSKTAAMEDINIAPPLVDAADAGTTFIKKKKPIIRKDVLPVGSAVDRARIEAGKFINKINDKTTPESGMQFITPTSERKLALLRGNAVPPSMRGGAKRAEGWAPRKVPSMAINQGAWSGLKKGGRVKKATVTGAAKRGFGRALMKGKK